MVHAKAMAIATDGQNPKHIVCHYEGVSSGGGGGRTLPKDSTALDTP